MNDYIKLGKDFGIDWDYILVKDVTFNFGNKYKIPREFKNQWFWIRMIDGDLFLTVYKDYAWDGCSCVPDFNGTVMASLIHDVIYQFSDILKKIWGWSLPKTLKLADNLFLVSMEQNGTKKIVSKTYYYGVRIFGLPFRLINKAIDYFSE